MMLQTPDIEMVRALTRQRDVVGLMALAGAGEVMIEAEVLAAVAQGLGMLADPDSLPAVLRLAKDRHLQVRVEAIGALARFADPAARAALQSASQDVNVVVRREAERVQRQLSSRVGGAA